MVGIGSSTLCCKRKYHGCDFKLGRNYVSTCGLRARTGGGQHICFELLTKHEIGTQYSMGNVVVWIERELKLTNTSVSNEKVRVIVQCKVEHGKLYKTTVMSSDFAVLNICTVIE
jgi:hypothetical protein